jgi:hypothetical protein
MKALRVQFTTAGIAVALLVGAALTFSMTSGAARAWAHSESKGKLRVTKECSQWQGAAGQFCTITASNVGPIKADSKVYYDQAAGTPAGLLDSNVILDAGSGNRAFGRCTVVLPPAPSGGTGLCTFSDGTGEFAGFQARIDVTPMGGAIFAWNGTYSFDHDRDGR